MSFVVYDIVFMVLFTLAVIIFLYTRKHNLQRQGLLYLYKTKVGLKIIEYISEKYFKLLKPLQYLVLASGYLLLFFMLWFLVKFTYFYITSSYAAKALKVPVIFPLIPYLPEIFKVDFLPPFYFTYWIIIIAIIAIPHEFAHGIFARLNKVKIHSTGFGFLGPFLAFFVEQDEKHMNKASRFSQLSILAAGTFANVLMTILFGIIMWLFFISAFTPAGVFFSTYSTSVIQIQGVDKIGNISIDDFSQYPNLLDLKSRFIEVTTKDNKTYFTNPSIVESSIEQNLEYLIVYDNSPAFKSRIEGAITSIDGKKITSYNELRNAILEHKPGDIVKIKTISDKKINEYEIQLAEKDGNAFLGIGVSPPRASGFLGWIYSLISKIKDPFVYYKSSIGDLGIFIYNLLWWIVIVNISVALTNMLPVGIFDGGRFFMLSIWSLTGSRKIGENAFKISTWLILVLLFLLMLKWAFAVF